MDKIQGFDDWNAGANPGKLEEKRKKTPAIQGDVVIKAAEDIIDEKPAKDEEGVKEQLDRLNTTLADIRRLKRKAKHRSDDKQELMDLIDQLKAKRKTFRTSKKVEKKLPTERRIKWKDVDGKFKLIRRKDRDDRYDTYIFKSTDKDVKIFTPDGRMTEDASEYLKGIFDDIDDFNVIETEVNNAEYDKKKQSVEFRIDKRMVSPNTELLSDDDKEEGEDTPTHIVPAVPVIPNDDLENDGKENALDIIVAAREGRSRESFASFDEHFLIEWAAAIEGNVPYWVDSKTGKEHRTLTAKALRGNEPEVIAYNKANVTSSSGSVATSYTGNMFTPEQITKMQQWMYNNGGAPVKHAIEFSGGIDGKIGKGFDRAVNYLIKHGVISDVNDLLTKTMDTNQFRMEHKPFIAQADSTHVDTSRYNIPKD